MLVLSVLLSNIKARTKPGKKKTLQMEKLPLKEEGKKGEDYGGKKKEREEKREGRRG